MLTYHCQFLLHGLSDHVGRGDVFNPQRRINGFMFFSLSVLNLEDHLGLVISPQSPLSAGYITLRACRRSLPLRFSTVTPGGIVGFLIVSYRFNIPDRLAVHLSIHARPELRAHCRLCPLTPFIEAIDTSSGVCVAFIVTDDDRHFQSVTKRLPKDVEPVRLYESYLTNFSFTSGEWTE